MDINIFAHPHYDTYHDLAIVHWHAFKVPDSALLSFRCDCVVCTDVVDDETGQNSCEQIPTVSQVFMEKCLFFALGKLSA